MMAPNIPSPEMKVTSIETEKIEFWKIWGGITASGSRDS